MDERIYEAVANGNPDMFKEALDYLNQKAVLPYPEFKKIRERYRSLVFSVKGYTEIEILDKFLNELKEAVTNGSTKDQFRKTMNMFLTEHGYDGLTPYHSDLIFRQNIQTAYNVGHYKQMTEPGVMEKRKYWQYVTAGDGRVRESHQAMDGKIYPANDTIWDTWFPPNGFGCRCTVVSLTPKQIERKGLSVSEQLPNVIGSNGEIEAALPDPHFRENPAKAEWSPDLAGFPPELKKIYNNAQKADSTAK